MKSIQGDETEGKDRAIQAREWRELEYYKREVRGIPRLLGTTLKEIDAIQRARRAPKEVNAPSFTEVESETTKESILPQTVPTPPTPEPPLDGGVVCNKQPHNADGFSEVSSRQELMGGCPIDGSG